MLLLEGLEGGGDGVSPWLAAAGLRFLRRVVELLNGRVGEGRGRL